MAISKAGTIYNTEAWRRLCAAVFQRDGYRCRGMLPTGQRCGAVGKQIGGTATLTGAHLVSSFVAPERALDPANVVTLCRRCHGRLDGGKSRGGRGRLTRTRQSL